MKSPKMIAPGNSGVVGWWHHIVSHGPVLSVFLQAWAGAGDPILASESLTIIREEAS